MKRKRLEGREIMKKKKMRILIVCLIFALSLVNIFSNSNIAYAATTVNNETELRNAINAGETEITIGNDFSLSETIEIKNKGNLTINGNDKTISNGEAEKLQLFKIEGSKVTFENITLDGRRKA